MLGRLSLAATALALAALLLLPAAAPATSVGSDDPADPVVVVVGDVDVPRGEAVEAVYVLSGDVRVDGRVSGDVVVLSGDVVVAGEIEGELFTANGTARVEAGAEIGGDVTYADQRPSVSLDAVVGGTVKKEGMPDLGSALPVVGSLFLVWLAVSISAAVLGALLLLIAPRAGDALYERSRERLGPTIAIGIAILIVLPVAAILAAITLLGLPLALGLLLALLPLWAIAYCVAAWALGRRIVGPPRERILAFLAGLAILRGVELVPLVGGLATLAAMIFGLGLIGATIGAARKPPADPAAAQTPDS